MSGVEYYALALSWFHPPLDNTFAIALQDSVLRATPPIYNFDFTNGEITSHYGAIALKQRANCATYEVASKASADEVVNRSGALIT